MLASTARKPVGAAASRPFRTDHRQAIAELIARFGHWLDGGAGRPEDFYLADAEVVSPRATLRGLDAISRFVADTGDERVQHVHGDLVIDVDGDRARVRANQLVYFFEPGRAPHRTSGLRVEHELRRTDAGWRIARLELALQWLDGDLPPAPGD